MQPRTPPLTCPTCQAENEPEARACIACGQAFREGTPILGEGSLFASRYEILAALGRGGMGMVYKARDRSLDETVALKIIRPDLARQSALADRFRSEIRLARRIRHRNVCSIFGDGEERGMLYLCMELVEGVDLKRLIREGGVLPRGQAYDAAIQIAEGLQAIHEVGIVHRDLKTANIMRDEKGVVRLMDFGLAKRWQTEDSSGATATGHVVGTPDYMSPEQARGEKIGPESDIYALGIVIYELFTGEVPFKGDTPLTTLLKHLHEPPPLAGAMAARIPPAVVPVLRRALAKDPFERYHSAREMAEALRRGAGAAFDASGVTPLWTHRPPGTAAATPPTEDLGIRTPDAAPGSRQSTAGPARTTTRQRPLASRRRRIGRLIVPAAGMIAVAFGLGVLAPRIRFSSETPKTHVAPAPVPMAIPPPLIRHEPVDCLLAGQFPVIEATIDASDPIKARVFFKSALGEAYYFVEMARREGRFVGKLPRPSAASSPISYYVLAQAPRRESRTPEYRAIVAPSEAECSGRRMARIGPAGSVTVFSALVGTDLLLTIGNAFGLEALLDSLEDPDVEVREGSAKSLAEMGAPTRQAIAQSVQWLGSSQAESRRQAARDLGTTGRHLLKQVMGRLVEALRDAKPSVRTASAEALGEIGPAGAAAVMALRGALKDEQAEVRKAAADALGSMGTVVATTLTALDAVRERDPDPKVRQAAAAAWKNIRG